MEHSAALPDAAPRVRARIVSERVVVASVIVAAHVALIMLFARSARPSLSAGEVVFVSLPIWVDEAMRESVSTKEDTAGGLRPFAPRVRRLQEQTSGTEVLQSERAAPIDWFAEARTTAGVLEERTQTEGARRNLAGSNHKRVEPRKAPYSVFEKSEQPGRIEKNPEGELVLWISERCYSIVETQNIMHKGMTMCFMPLDKRRVRGELFDHMREVPPPPQDKATDVP
jgi:hypothetical protein